MLLERYAPGLNLSPRVFIEEGIMMSRKMLLGLGVGAAVAYFAAPQRRRAQMKDQFTRVSEKARKAFDSTRRGVSERASNMVGYTQANWNATPQRMSSR